MWKWGCRWPWWCRCCCRWVVLVSVAVWSVATSVIVALSVPVVVQLYLPVMLLPLSVVEKAPLSVVVLESVASWKRKADTAHFRKVII